MSETKDTNPKDSIGIKKVPVSTVPARVVMEVGLAMLEGACKYGRHNYRVAGVRASVYYDAMRRHIDAWWEGEDIDPDSGLSHIIKAMACLTVLRDSMHQGNWQDDRPPQTPSGWIQELNDKAAEILNKFPNPKQAYICKSWHWTPKQLESILDQATNHSSSPPVTNTENLEDGDSQSIPSQDPFNPMKGNWTQSENTSRTKSSSSTTPNSISRLWRRLVLFGKDLSRKLS